jgi:hypothetical protein
MTVGGAGIPRLQELAYLEAVATAVSVGKTFEGIRLALLDHIWSSREQTPGADPPDPAEYKQLRDDEKKLVRNVTDALKELMRLGFVESARLPSSGKSAYAHKNETYSLTPSGEQWVGSLVGDRARAYDDLLVPRLIRHHPRLASFLAVTGTLGDAGRNSFVVPLLRWGELPEGRRSQATYRAAVGEYVAAALMSSDLGWTADAAEVTEAVSSYLDRVQARAQAHGREDPFPTNRTFTQTCEEALVKLAFKKAGIPIDYVSVEIARRWSRWLGLASFTYHVPGPHALRFWSTARIRQAHGTLQIDRRVGGEWRDRALDAVYDYCQQLRAAGTTYVPVWVVRAAVCWRLRIVDDEFDRAVTEMIAGRRGQDRTWRVHLDQVSVGHVPSSATPFVLTTATAGTRTYNVMTIVPKFAS